jgi:OPA family glycerol-3-phosphate transporter-like MFS transporter
VAAYFGRINLSIAIPLLEDRYLYSKTVLGFLAAGFFIFYAGGQFINGTLGDRFNPRYFVAAGLLGSGLANILFCLFPFPPVMFVFCALNGYFQSMLWGPLLRTIAEYVPAKKLNGAVFLMATSPLAGYFLSYTGLGKAALFLGWRAVFLIPGAVLAAAAALWFRCLKGCECGAEADQQARPEKRGIPFLRSGRAGGKRQDAKPPLGALVYFIFSKKLYFVIILGVMAGAVKEGLSFWGPSLLVEQGEMGMEAALRLMSFIPVITALFIIANGFIINRALAGIRRMISLFALIASAAALLMRLGGIYSFPVLLAAFYALMAAISSVNNLMTSYLPLEYRQDGRISSAAGLIDSSFYLGAAFAGPAAGAAADRFGWPGIYTGLALVCLAALAAAVFSMRSKPDRPPFQQAS